MNQTDFTFTAKDLSEIPKTARGSEVGIIILLKMVGQPKVVARIAHYTVSRVYQVKRKFDL